jgi:hypothetical protein
MDFEKQLLIAKGSIKHIPGARFFLHPPQTGGTNESRYCYSVWFRHMEHWFRYRSYMPETVAELGPGDTPGIGFAALLSGVKHIYSLDVVKYWYNDRNLRIFEELVQLFKSKADIPDNSVYPRVKPVLDDYRFPSNILPDGLLKETLAEERLNAIRVEIMDINNPDNIIIKPKIPWHKADVLDKESVDFIYSQAVLECIDDLDNTYLAMCRWIKPGGLMSHTIDLKSHGLMKDWNGHWKFSRLEWWLTRGAKSFLVNRQPVSAHVRFHRIYGFRILEKKSVISENKLDINSFSKEFRGLSEEDLTTSGVYILSEKGGTCDKREGAA